MPSPGTEKACASDRGLYLFRSGPPRTSGSPIFNIFSIRVLRAFILFAVWWPHFGAIGKPRPPKNEARRQRLSSCGGLFQDAFARKLKKLVLATGVLICFSQDLQKKGSPHLQPILNPLVASRRLISTNMPKNPFAFFHAATKVEVGASFENVGLGLEALRHPEHPDDPACRQQRLRGLRPRQLQ